MMMDLDINTDGTEVGAPVPFSFEPSGDYIRYMQDTPMSLSINYFKQVYDVVNVTVTGGGVDALTDKGNSVYVNQTE